MTVYALVSVFGPDRVGLVSAITGRLFDLGINLGDTTFAVLGEGAEFTAICQLPRSLTLAALNVELTGLPELRDLRVEVVPFELDPVRQPSARITHHIACEGPDQPGLLARLSEALTGFGANIVRINARQAGVRESQIYVIRIAVRIPEGKEQACRATLDNTAGQLGQTLSWEAVEGAAPPGR